MSFTAVVKASLLAYVEAIEPTPDVNPLQAQLDALQTQLDDALVVNAGLSGQLTAMTEQRDAAQDELDSVNARLEATQGQKRISVSILDAPGYSDVEKLLLIRDTLTDPA
jgi:DNA repair ATPase RecN